MFLFKNLKFNHKAFLMEHKFPKNFAKLFFKKNQIFKYLIPKNEKKN